MIRKVRLDSVGSLEDFQVGNLASLEPWENEVGGWGKKLKKAVKKVGKNLGPESFKKIGKKAEAKLRSAAKNAEKVGKKVVKLNESFLKGQKDLAKAALKKAGPALATAFSGGAAGMAGGGLFDGLLGNLFGGGQGESSSPPERQSQGWVMPAMLAGVVGVGFLMLRKGK